VFEAEGVCSVYCDEQARDSALSYARAEIQVLDDAWNVVETIGNEEARPLGVRKLRRTAVRAIRRADRRSDQPLL
jgi:hypothetical protein